MRNARKTLGMLCIAAAIGVVRADTTLPTWKD